MAPGGGRREGAHRDTCTPAPAPAMIPPGNRPRKAVAREARLARNALAGVAPVRQEKVNVLHEAIEQGVYEVGSTHLADDLLGSDSARP